MGRVEETKGCRTKGSGAPWEKAEMRAPQSARREREAERSRGHRVGWGASGWKALAPGHSGSGAQGLVSRARSAPRDLERRLGQKGSRGSAPASAAAGSGLGARHTRQGAGPRGRRPPHLGSGSRIFLLARAAGVALLFSMAIR